ncbi:MAG: ATP-grasp domain-containing protein [Chitinophagales bacterium]
MSNIEKHSSQLSKRATLDARQKPTILFLGAATFQLPPIQNALNKGYRVITADNRPDNPGHCLAHQSYNVSIIDQSAILQVAKKETIDGILSFGSDIGAPVAAYVAQELGLPTNSLKAVQTLQNKFLFRKFLQENKLQSQHFKSFSLHQKNDLLPYLAQTPLPSVIKPTDSAGSKGVNFLQNLQDAPRFIEEAFQYSLSNTIIVEQFFQKKGKQICGDGFMHQGHLVFIEMGDGHFYENDPEFTAPYAETFPCSTPNVMQRKVQHQLELILQKVGYHNGTFNFDVFITSNNQVFVNEIGPRSGGNYIPLAIKLNTGVDLIDAVVEASFQQNYILPLPPAKPKTNFASPSVASSKWNGQTAYYHACYMIHSRKSGILQGITYAPEIIPHIFLKHPYLHKGAKIHPFRQGNRAIGNLILRFQNLQEQAQKMARIHHLVQVNLI